ncbi:ferritin-like domain-containing protein [Metabacillus litoralis]|uniref:ferritin-like domain-containing protein n=1 Tax=Metabacillus litoralis TaxID=152268 RepID=UPI001CFD2006|nr:ferritin-like domain-containing protein [Metabacillus litoralis]
MENSKVVLNTLNKFLKGQYMGIHAYEHYIEKLEDLSIKNQFQEIQQDHKQHALLVAERIQNLGGTPVDSEGLIGSVQGYISQMMIPDSVQGIIDNARKGESYYGIDLSEELVRGDLDAESRKLIENILDKDRQHVKLLESFLQ